MKNYIEYINEDIFNFFKKEKKEYYYLEIGDDFWNFIGNYVENLKPGLTAECENLIAKATKIKEDVEKLPWRLNELKKIEKEIRKKSYILKKCAGIACVFYIKNNVVGNTIRIKKILKDTKISDFYEKEIGKDKFLFIDEKKHEYSVSLIDCSKIEIKKEVHRSISKLDPYGEEAWEE